MVSYTISTLDSKDLDAWVDCEFETFRGDALHEVVCPTPQTSVDAQRGVIERAGDLPNGDGVLLLKANDKVSGKVIGGIKMRLHGGEDAKIKSPYLALIKEADPAADEDVNYRAAVMNVFYRRRVDSISGPHASESQDCSLLLRVVLAANRHTAIELLFVHPDFGRRGLGAELVARGCQLADDLDFVSYVEASPQGKRAYELNGFASLDTVKIALAQWPDKPEHLHYFMARQPAVKAGCHTSAQ